MRVVTWNVNGIRRVHRDLIRQGKRTFLEVLEHLEGDIICLQELKSEKSTLDPIYVNVPGWRSYFSFPVDKKAYSGVAIYVRECFRPIKVETAICGPAFDRFFESDSTELIGGYPRHISTVEARLLDREGRAVVLDFGGFVMIGTYCPAGAEAEDRVAYRRLWWKALRERCENLIENGRELVLLGDLNVHCEAIDQVEADLEEFELENLGPVGTIFHEILHGQNLERQEATPENGQGLRPQKGRVSTLLHDTTRRFHPERPGMFTVSRSKLTFHFTDWQQCWSVKLSARQGNYGSRIDFVLASEGLLPYILKSDIRPDIHGSDHCPVYTHFAADAAEPVLQISRSSAEDMDSKSNFTSSQQILSPAYFRRAASTSATDDGREARDQCGTTPPKSQTLSLKRTFSDVSKKSNDIAGLSDARKPQQTISAFFQKSGPPSIDHASDREPKSPIKVADIAQEISLAGRKDGSPAFGTGVRLQQSRTDSIEKRIEVSNAFATLFTRPEIPLCTGHQKPAKLQKTKKKGANQGREFWMCAMPLGDGQCSFWKWRKK